jgi:acetoin utilization deacetylase AcuC-like enzyme
MDTAQLRWATKGGFPPGWAAADEALPSPDPSVNRPTRMRERTRRQASRSLNYISRPHFKPSLPPGCAHCMYAYYADAFVLDLPPGHRFPMAKYAMLRQAVREQLPAIHLRAAPAARVEDILRVHEARYVHAVLQGELSPAEQREIGLPWSAALPERSKRSVGATLAAMRAAQREGVACNMAGGTHHAYAHKGSGFCVFNDIAVATRVLQHQAHAAGGSADVAIIDLDVHQGNGTADVFATDPQVFTLSMHGEKNFPFRKATSDLDVGLPDGCGDTHYLAALRDALTQLDERFAPDMVFYLAGADPHEGDRLGKLKLTDDGMAERDRTVFEWARQRRLPLAFAMAGGYGVDLTTTVRVQTQTLRIASELSGHWPLQRRWTQSPPT